MFYCICLPHIIFPRSNSTALQPHLTSQQLNHHHSTNPATHSKLTLLRRQNPPAIPSPSIAKQPTQLLQLFSTHPCGFPRTARPFSVSRYFCRRDRGLSGIVYSSMPSESNISRTDFLNLVLSVLPSVCINSSAVRGIMQLAATRSKTVSTDLPSGLSALTWCPDLVPRLSPDCAPTGFRLAPDVPDYAR